MNKFKNSLTKYSLSLSEQLRKWDAKKMAIIYQSKDQENIEEVVKASPFKTFSPETLRRIAAAILAFMCIGLIVANMAFDAAMTGVNYG